MNARLLLSLLPILLWCCSEKSGQRANSDKAAAQLLTYADSSTSSFRFLKQDTIGGLQYRTVETTYKVVSVDMDDKELTHYLVKFNTITDAGTQLEGQTRTIQFALSPLENPSKTILTAKHDCDELTFDWQHYQTVKHGCCGSLDQVNYYDYQNKLLIEGDSKIVAASIPNQFTFYFAFQSEQGKDTTTIGTLNLSYSSSEAYHIKIKALHPASEDCGPVVPIVTLRSTNAKDTYDEGSKQYDLWSQEHNKSPRELNGLTIRVNFDCDSKLGIIDIPLVNGRPFGKEDKNQVYQVKNRSRE
ncbi:hypothetical protein GO755_35600 [Spirosoma sp. HMF4905]|uniref:Uncharacterized protein n=1 Tax=Spirosoma arboris TaxID=2682092 RepID=A0A7K1SNP1_9BACT|nr:hypothetical protein [Spirosoma arboris]MVM35401.1 hypothetical protein [Spirosoma arboris]